MVYDENECCYDDGVTGGDLYTEELLDKERAIMESKASSKSYYQQIKEEEARCLRTCIRSMLAMTLFFILFGMACFYLTGCERAATPSERLSGLDQLSDSDRAELQQLINNLPED